MQVDGEGDATTRDRLPSVSALALFLQVGVGSGRFHSHRIPTPPAAAALLAPSCPYPTPLFFLFLFSHLSPLVHLETCLQSRVESKHKNAINSRIPTHQLLSSLSAARDRLRAAKSNALSETTGGSHPGLDLRVLLSEARKRKSRKQHHQRCSTLTTHRS